MSEALISIGIPVYNGERYLEEALLSNVNQSYSNLEIVISDNASTDRTETICRDFAASDERIRFYRNERNVGAASNYNRVFELSTGEYFRWSNADDLAAPDLVARTLPVLESEPDAVIAYGRTCLIDAEGISLGEFDDNLDLREDRPSERYVSCYDRARLTNIIYGLMRRSAMQKTALMGKGKFPHADIHFMTTMALLGKFVELPETLFYRRMHEGAMSADREGQHKQTFWNASNAAFVLPNWRFELAGVGATLGASIPVAEKVRLLSFSARRMVWRRRELAQDLLRIFS